MSSNKKKPPGYWYTYVKRRRDRIKERYGFGAGLLWRYGLKILIPVYEKYQSQCADCSTTDNLTIHHIDGEGRNRVDQGRKDLVNNRIENLILLCRRCHGARDGKKKLGVKHAKRRN